MEVYEASVSQIWQAGQVVRKDCVGSGQNNSCVINVLYVGTG